MHKEKFTIKDMTLIPIFAALTAVLTQITIPLPFTPIPINLATLSVFLAGGFLGAYKGMISQLVYLVVGAVGIPVFSLFRGGLGMLVGPTGGYLVGYVVSAFVVGALLEATNPVWRYAVAMAIGMVVCYTVGTAWFMYLTQTQLVPALTMCVFPFLIGDALKILAGALLVKRLEFLRSKTALLQKGTI